jgi:ankyrin repeat protein
LWPEDLDKTLEKLPDDLFGVYDRFLEAIRSDHFVYVEAVLRWIMFSTLRRITVVHLADAAAFDFSDPEQYVYKPSRRAGNTVAILKWLAGLVDTCFPDGPISLAHASVQDYLLSKHFMAKFGADLTEGLSHTFISQTCIGYLVYFGDHPLDETTRRNYPLANYAAYGWCHHLQNSHDQGVLFASAMRLLQDGSEQYRTLSHLLTDFESRRVPVGSPLHLCCKEGYLKGVRGLLANDADVNLVRGQPGSPLMIACKHGYTNIVHLLLGSGANVNLPGGKYASALATACYGGNMELVHLLLDHGADVNLRDKRYGSALSAASFGGQIEIVHLLLLSGADVNREGGEYGSALGAASFGGHVEIVDLLLKSGANINLQCGDYGSAVAAAARGGYLEIVSLLHGNGADINLPSGKFGDALSSACYRGKIEIVHLLLECGADFNLPGGDYGSALAAASLGNEPKIVSFLLERGADVNLQCGYYGSALAAASFAGYIEIVNILIEHGADVNLQTGLECVLAIASSAGQIEVVRCLLENGADLESQGNRALNYASEKGHDDIIALLREAGAVSDTEEDIRSSGSDTDTLESELE